MPTPSEHKTVQARILTYAEAIMKPNISEFSYGYALINGLINWSGTPLTAAPVFPSLYQEGKAGGGYDAMLQWPYILLFLQFKLSHYMIGNNAQEVKCGIFRPPFYRMHVRPRRHSNQHKMLLDLENDGKLVFYVAPAFHTSDEFNKAYFSHQILPRSFWIKPSKIGSLPDDQNHHVTFARGCSAYFFSTPRSLECQGDFAEFEEFVASSFEEKHQKSFQQDALKETAERIAEIAKECQITLSESERVSLTELVPSHPLEQIAFYSQVFFNSQLFIIRKRDSETGSL